MDYVKKAVTGTDDYHEVMTAAARDGLERMAGYIAPSGLKPLRIQYSMFDDDEILEAQSAIEFAVSEWYRLADVMVERCNECLNIEKVDELRAIADEWRLVNKFLKSQKKHLPSLFRYCSNKLWDDVDKRTISFPTFHQLFIGMGHL